jgi:hypothetical protein
MMSQKSETWAAMFEVPQLPNMVTEGSNDDDPIHINAESGEFNYLVQYLYDLYVIETHSLTQWLADIVS